MDNPVLKLRQIMGWSQQFLAQQVGKSFSSIRLYEKSWESCPRQVRLQLARLAAANGMADLGVELAGEYAVKNIIRPGEHLISTDPAHVRDTPMPKPDEDWHGLLEEIFESEDSEAIEAVKGNLIVFTRYVRRNRKEKIDKKGGLSGR